MLKQGDIVLIPVPFTDQSSQKRRPVIVISNNQYNRKTTDNDGVQSLLCQSLRLSN